MTVSRDHVDAALALAMRAAPYARHVLSAARIVISDRLPSPTAACDRHWRVYVHPDVPWSAAELGWVLLHECLGHLARQHHAASARYPAEPAMRINIAQDLEIESWEWHTHVARPAGTGRGVHPSDYSLPAGETWEWYLAHLPAGEEMPGIGCGSGAHGQAEPWEMPAGPGDIMPGSAHETAIVQATAAAIAAAAGHVPAGMEVWADAVLAPPKIDWRQRVRATISARCAAGATDMTGPARERAGGVLARKWRGIRPRIAIVADTSGSMTSCGGAVLGTVVEIARVAGEADVIWIDTEPRVQHGVRHRSELRPVGGGGTDIRDAIYLAREGRYDLVIVVTDCETPWPDNSCGEVVVALDGGVPPHNWRTIHVN